MGSGLTQDGMFPRGKEPIVTENKSDKKNKARKQASNGASGHGDVPDVRTALLNYRSLAVGMQLLGVVQGVSGPSVQISLPSGLVGFAPRDEVLVHPPAPMSEPAADDSDNSDADDNSDTNDIPDHEELNPSPHPHQHPTPTHDPDTPRPIGTLLTPNQLVRVSITALFKTTSGKKRIAVTLHPDHLNRGLAREALARGRLLYGVVRTREDHGYTVSLGENARVAAFLPAELVDGPDAAGGAGSPVVVGAPVECVVLDNLAGKKKVPRVVRVTARRDIVRAALVHEYAGMSVDNLQVGMAVNARVYRLDEKTGGLGLTFLTFFHGSVDVFHVGGKQLSVGDKVKARILFVDPTLKRVGLTLREDLVDRLASPVIDTRLSDGVILDQAAVERIDPGVGVMLRAESLHTETKLYAHVSRVSDDRIDNLHRYLRVGDQRKCRVVSASLLDGVALVSLRESVIDRVVYRYQDVKVGAIYECKVRALMDFGCIVAVESNIQALIPTDQLADTKLRKPQLKFKIDARIRCRVLSVDAERKRILATCRRSLVDSRLPFLPSPHAAANFLGKGIQGYVTAVTDNLSVVVALGGGARGAVPVAELGLPELPTSKTEVETAFPLGKAVEVWIFEVSQPRRVSLTMRGRDVANELAQETGKSLSLQPGLILNVSFVAARDNDCIVRDKDSGTECLIAYSHLSDFDSLVPLHLERLKQAKDSGPFQALVIAVPLHGRPLGTCKKSLLVKAISGTLPMDIDAVERRFEADDRLLEGYVRKSLPTGIVVGLGGKCFGFVRKSRISDAFVAHPEDRCADGQSVIVVVESVDKEKGRIMLTMRSSDLLQQNSSLAVARLAHFFDERADLLPSNLGNTPSKFSIGDVAKVVASSRKSSGVLFRFRNDKTKNVLAVAVHSQIYKDTKIEENESYTARILDIDESKGLFDLSLLPEVVKRVRAAESSLKEGMRIKVVIRLIKTDYAIVTCPSAGNAVAFACVGRLNDDIGPDSTLLPGMQMDAKVASKSSGNRILVDLDFSTGPDQQIVTKLSLSVGDSVSAKATAVKSMHVNFQLQPGVSARLHATETTVANTRGQRTKAFDGVKVGQTIMATVASIEGNSETGYKVELTQLPADQSPSLGGRERLWSRLRPSELVNGVVKSTKRTSMVVAVSPMVSGKVDVLGLPHAEMDLVNKGLGFTGYSSGQVITCRVLKAREENDLLCLGIPAQSGDESEKEKICLAKVLRVVPAMGIEVALAERDCRPTFGKISITEISDDFETVAEFLSSESCVKPGRYVRVVGIKDNATHSDLSMRLSRFHSSSPQPKDKIVSQVTDCVPSARIRGFVRATSSKGCFVNLGPGVVGRILLSDLADGFVQNIETAFPVGKLVAGHVKTVKAENGEIDISLRTQRSDADEMLQRLRVGRTEQGVVKAVQDFGVFVRLSGGLSGLCHKSELSDVPIADPKQKFSPGQRVTVVILKVDMKKHRVTLGMKKSSIAEAELRAAEEDAEVESDVDDSGTDSEMADEEFEDEDKGMNEDDEDGAIENTARTTTPVRRPASEDLEVLHIPGRLEFSDDDEDENERETNFDVDADGEEEDEEELQEEAGGGKRKKSSREKRAKKRQKAEQERETQERERSVLDALGNPQTDEDFERALMGSPNNSMLWIRYMALCLSLSQVSRAREVAERALKTVSVVRGGEKMNIWLAFINLEAFYGETKDSAMQLLRRASQNVNDKHLYLKVFDSLHKTKPELAEDVYRLALKKHKSSKKVWIAGAQAKFEGGRADEGRRHLEKALLSLPQRKHIATALKLGQLEYRFGNVERGRTAFESLVGNFVRRLDLWGVYLDMETSKLRKEEKEARDTSFIRALYERCCSLDFSSKKMKFLFKRFLKFEQEFGTQESIDHVKDLARAYVESKME